MTEHFALRRGAAFTEQYDSAPDDPLGELTEVEIGLRRFCFDLQCDVIIEVGVYKKRSFSTLTSASQWMTCPV